MIGIPANSMSQAANSRYLVAVAAILVSNTILITRHLDHEGITYWDESFHAVVAKNLLKHPFKPTLIEEPYLSYAYQNWDENHVWIHKPTLPLWLIAISYRIFGVSTWALRLPSAILSVGAVGLTIAIGSMTLDRRTGLIAGAMQATSPALVSLVQGYQFGDHVDIALLFFVEAGIYFALRAIPTGSWPCIILAGFAQGLGYLSKSYLAAVVGGVTLSAILLGILTPKLQPPIRVGWAHLAVMVAATVLTALPWTAYCALRFPNEFLHEHSYVWQHLNSALEGWQGPWDRIYFNYLIYQFHAFYTPILVAMAALLPSAIRRRQLGLLLVYAWTFGVLIPLTLASTKTPMAMVEVTPACFLILGRISSEAWAGGRWPSRFLTGAMVMSLLAPGNLGLITLDPEIAPGFAAEMRRSLWVVWHVIGAFEIALILAFVDGYVGTWVSNDWRRIGSRVRSWLTILALIVLGRQTVQAGLVVTDRNESQPPIPILSAFVHDRFPPNAVLIFSGNHWQDHQLAMLLSGRTCYRLKERQLDEAAEEILERGGLPLVVSDQDPGPPCRLLAVFPSLSIYQYDPSGTTFPTPQPQSDLW